MQCSSEQASFISQYQLFTDVSIGGYARRNGTTLVLKLWSIFEMVSPLPNSDCRKAGQPHIYTSKKEQLMMSITILQALRQTAKRGFRHVYLFDFFIFTDIKPYSTHHADFQCAYFNTISLWSSLFWNSVLLRGKGEVWITLAPTIGLCSHPVLLFLCPSEGQVRLCQQPWVRLSFCCALCWLSNCYRIPDYIYCR